MMMAICGSTLMLHLINNKPVEKSFIKWRRKPGVGQSVVHWDPGGVLVGFT